MKKEKIIILAIVVLILMILGIVGAIMILNNKNENQKIAAREEFFSETIEKTLQQVTERNNFYIVQSCVEKFYTYYSEIYDEEYEGYLINSEEDKQNVKNKRIEKVFKMLDEEYINKTEMTLENFTSKMPKIKNTTLIINDMYYQRLDEINSVYFVYGIKNGTINSEAEEIKVMLRLDSKNKTFKIILGELVESYYNKLTNGEQIEIQEIADEIYNTYSYEHITENDYINDLFNHYKKTMRINKEYTYNLLDEEYKTLCFEDQGAYLSYLDENYSKIVSARIEEYLKEEKEDYTEYIFKDKKGNYYIFKEKGPFNYTVIPDNYVIPTEDFAGQYKILTNNEKAVLNIEKFFMGINDKNYAYSYSVLAESFKNAKYSTKNDFINYVKGTLFEKNEINYLEYEEQNGLYIYKIKILDANGNSTDEKFFNMIVKLNSGTNFEISFGEE